MAVSYTIGENSSSSYHNALDDSRYMNSHYYPSPEFYTYPYHYYLSLTSHLKSEGGTKPVICNQIYSISSGVSLADSGIDLWNEISYMNTGYYNLSTGTTQYKLGYISPGTRPSFHKELFNSMDTSQMTLAQCDAGFKVYVIRGSSLQINVTTLSGSTILSRTYSASDFPDKFIPKRLLVQLCAGGGSGGGGTWLGLGGSGGSAGSYAVVVLNLDGGTMVIECGAKAAAMPASSDAKGNDGADITIYRSQETSRTFVLKGGCGGYAASTEKNGPQRYDGPISSSHPDGYYDNNSAGYVIMTENLIKNSYSYVGKKIGASGLCGVSGKIGDATIADSPSFRSSASKVFYTAVSDYTYNYLSKHNKATTNIAGGYGTSGGASVFAPAAPQPDSATTTEKVNQGNYGAGGQGGGNWASGTGSCCVVKIFY